MKYLNFKIIKTERKTKFVEKYNYGKGIVDLDEYVIKVVDFCTLGCAYCYLQDVHETKEVKVFTNVDKLKDEITSLQEKTNKTLYFNAGENADSLLFDNIFPISKYLVEIFNKIENAYLELRTKTNNINNLLKIPHKDNVIVAFSLSPQNIIEKYEPKSASLDERLGGLSALCDTNYKIGLRFEPIINTSDIEESYSLLIGKIAKKIPSCKIHSISLSTLRFTKGLMKKIEKKNLELICDEIFPCPDGKYRYFRYIRVEIYRKIINIIKKFFPDVPVFLSCEFDYIWKDVGLKIVTLPEISTYSKTAKLSQ